MNKRGPKPQPIKKAAKKYSFDADVIRAIEERFIDGEKSRFVNSAVKEKLAREEGK